MVEIDYMDEYYAPTAIYTKECDSKEEAISLANKVIDEDLIEVLPIDAHDRLLSMGFNCVQEDGTTYESKKIKKEAKVRRSIRTTLKEGILRGSRYCKESGL